MSTTPIRRWHGLAVGESPAFRHVLVVDDNDFYAERLSADLAARGATCERACSAAEGMAMLDAGRERYDAVVTDISMETELAGLKVLRHARRIGFRGQVASATTALDARWAFTLNRFFLGVVYRADYLIPKRPIARDGEVLWIRVSR
ncbi:hypothetical protein BJI67_15265 [Acidihalobacter aeolianus]|uniref:Response regulatory domain-containing protein n=1 Tax=Acidihalobacter aeolianus TaxID=2792603 RepID=A0A1D8KBA6_9GAMM|nr:response regulator [Acidihalobacter aeolianus]AOV18239.1 hypothetical protein BJI67_15265 [Acidihalobacter aeolianus]